MTVLFGLLRLTHRENTLPQQVLTILHVFRYGGLKISLRTLVHV
jgi:hypothetical protein